MNKPPLGALPPSPILELSDRMLAEKGIRVHVLREELNHPEIMGNKWRKLFYNLQFVQTENLKGIKTFGGAYSNHIAATAAAGRIYGINTVGVIRGSELSPQSNITLRQAAANGMEFQFVDRHTYQYECALISEQGLAPIIDAGWLWLPEGGTNAFAIKGCSEILPEQRDYDLVVTAIGTGGTFIGLLRQLNGKSKLLGFAALRGHWIQAHIQALIHQNQLNFSNYDVMDDQLFGGYGKHDARLLGFIKEFFLKFKVILDPIYTGKVMYFVWEMIKSGQIAENSKILVIHTGGIQGILGFNERYKTNLPVNLNFRV